MSKDNTVLTGSVVPVILCGGSGSRLWPMSRESYPKQFVDLGGGRTLFKDTLKRASDKSVFADPLIVCNEKYRFYVDEEMRDSGVKGEVILEPEPKNTAPATALAAFALARNSVEPPLMLVMPSDHHIGGVADFTEIIRRSAPAALAGRIITFGVSPTRPFTGYGYIKCGQQQDLGYAIDEFVEKPDQAKAQAMLASGGYLWNAGIFLMRPQVYLEELKKYAPDIYESCGEAWSGRKYTDKWIYPDAAAFTESPEDSIDYAVMEKTRLASVVPLPVPWDDLGSWESFYRYADRDEDNNARLGATVAVDTKNSYLRSTGRLVAAIGVDDMTIIETRDAVLVAKNSETQKVKNIVRQLKDRGAPEYQHHPLVYRPWGSYEVLAAGDRFQVKRIIVNPGQILSLQKHHHRAEHWIVVSGTAEVALEERVALYTENQSTYIPIGCRHRLRNPGLIPLIIIEIQSGTYLGEDDIVRLEDIYGRQGETN